MDLIMSHVIDQILKMCDASQLDLFYINEHVVIIMFTLCYISI